MVSISMSLFKQIINSAKQYVAKDDSRHFLGFIRIQAIAGQGLVIGALTGYRAIRIKVPVSCECQIEEDGIFYVRPLSFAVLMTQFVELRAEENATLITLPTEFGETVYKFKIPDWTFDLDKIFDTAGPFEQEWTCNPEFLNHVAKATGGARACSISVPENRCQSVMVKSKTEGFEVEQIILPTRVV